MRQPESATLRTAAAPARSRCEQRSRSRRAGRREKPCATSGRPRSAAARERRREGRGQLRKLRKRVAGLLERLQDRQAVSGDADATGDRVHRQRVGNRDDARAGKREPSEERPVRVDPPSPPRATADQPEDAVLVLDEPERPGIAEEQLHGRRHRPPGARGRDDVGAGSGLRGDKRVEERVVRHVVIVDEARPSRRRACAGSRDDVDA